MSLLDALDDTRVDDLFKGMPGGVEPFALSKIGTRKWNVLRQDLPLPLAVIKEPALEHNGRWMSGFLELSGAVIAPHGKTTMSPQLFQRQLEQGAWAITVATPHQIQVARRFGVERIILANQLIGPPAIRYVLDELGRDEAFEFYCLVDSVDNVHNLADAARNHPARRPLRLLLEGGNQGGRTGCRTLDAALEVARAVDASAPHLELHGVEGFEGLIEAPTPAEQDRRVRDFLEFLIDIAQGCEEEGLFAAHTIILSAGGSAFYDLVMDRFRRAGLKRRIKVVTRSGCYLTHDSAMYREFFARLQSRTPEARALGDGLRPALEVWAYVQSRPEPGKVILTMGRRDVSTDADLPIPEQWYRPGHHAAPQPAPGGCRVTGLNDQHTHMSVVENNPLRVGDMMSFGVSHPCTTFDKWQLICLVDAEYNVTSAIRTFF